jgi:hypothetical protein
MTGRRARTGPPLGHVTVALLMLAGYLLAPTPAVANSITVDTTADTSTATTCALREAMTAANNDTVPAGSDCAAGGGPDDTIGFSVTGTIHVATQLPSLDGDLAIEGPGSGQLVVRRNSGAPAFRIFISTAMGNSISGLTAANGGGTMTLALATGSPAIDAGLAPIGETTDQRGLTRPADLAGVTNAPTSDGADIGAFEVQAPPAPPSPPGPTGSSPAPAASENPACAALRSKLKRAKSRAKKRKLRGRLRQLGC